MNTDLNTDDSVQKLGISISVTFQPIEATSMRRKRSHKKHKKSQKERRRR